MINSTGETQVTFSYSSK